MCCTKKQKNERNNNVINNVTNNVSLCKQKTKEQQKSFFLQTKTKGKQIKICYEILFLVFVQKNKSFTSRCCAHEPTEFQLSP